MLRLATQLFATTTLILFFSPVFGQDCGDFPASVSFTPRRWTPPRDIVGVDRALTLGNFDEDDESEILIGSDSMSRES